MKGMTKGTRSIPSGNKGKTVVKAAPPKSMGKGPSQMGGMKPSGGRI